MDLSGLLGRNFILLIDHRERLPGDEVRDAGRTVGFRRFPTWHAPGCASEDVVMPAAWIAACRLLLQSLAL